MLTLTLLPPSAPTKKTPSCSSCKHFTKETESWEMPWVYWYECSSLPGVENLKNFPFKNGCKHYTPK